MSKPNGILAMDPEKYREIDGVVFDLESYERHCAPQEETAGETAPAEEGSPAPAPVFAVDPYPNGWYPAEEGRPPVPIMGGAVKPCETVEEGTTTVTHTVVIAGSGSGSGSYVTSYTTSYRSSGSGSYGSGSYGSGSCVFAAGGYGLELI